MTQQELTRGLRLVRYGGVVITVTVFVFLLGFWLVTGSAINGSTGAALSAGLPYIIGFTIMAAVLSVVLYFAYRAYASGRVSDAPAK